MKDKKQEKSLGRYAIMLAMLNIIKNDTSLEEGIALTEQEYKRILRRLQKKYNVFSEEMY